jgi:hypothetical protein
MIKNEIEILPMYYRYIKQWCSRWAIIDHGSDDGSLEFLQRMKKRKEIIIDIYERKSDDFNKDFYKEFNWIISKSKSKWTFVGHIDEFSPVMKDIIPQLITKEAAYVFQREECISLLPLMALERFEFVRLFPTKWKLRFIEGGDVHSEQLDIKKYGRVLVKMPYFHIGECRNIDHIRFKEKSYEDCSGKSVLTSKYTENDRELRRANAYYIRDYNLMDMLL